MLPDQHPNERLARQILDELRAANLVTADGENLFLQKLAAGTLKESDWKIALESALKAAQPTTRHETPPA